MLKEIKPIIITMACLCLVSTISAQEILTKQDSINLQDSIKVKNEKLKVLKSQLKTLNQQVNALNKEVSNIKEQLTPYPRWKSGLSGTAGFNITTYSGWLAKGTSNTRAANIGLTLSAFIEMQQKKYFWKNSMNSNMGWLKFDDKDDPDDNMGFQTASDAFNVTSLLGWKIRPKLALSLLGEYRTSMFNGTFNNPGYLDLGGGGITWNPASNFTAVLHSVNFNWVFSKENTEYESSLGTKVVLDYNRQFNKFVVWKSNLSTFVSYKNLSELSNWTWINHFSTAVKGVGIGLDIGLRDNKQESKAKELEDNPLQLYWILGLTYSLTKTSG